MQPRLYAVATVLALIVSAQGKARTYWQADPCHGQIAVTAAPLGTRNADAIYTTTDGDPDHFAACRIVLNSRQARGFEWTAEKLCTVIVHEYGHLLGRDHSADPHDVMYPVYLRPILACREHHWR